MKWTILIAIIFLIAGHAPAQSIPLTGTVAIQNSQYETGTRQFVKDASLRAAFTKPSTTDKDGRFNLIFDGVDAGTSIRLLVSKTGLEVVNAIDVEQVVLGRQNDLVIVMAEPGKLAAARERFHGLALANIEKAFAHKLHQLQDTTTNIEKRLADVSAELQDTMATLGDALLAVTAHRDLAREGSLELAQRFATVDLDNASALYVRAFELFNAGKVDSVLILLDQQGLDRDLDRAEQRKKEGGERIAEANRSIRELGRSFQLKADVQRSTLAFRDALKTTEALHTIMTEQRDAFDPAEEVRLLRSLADLHSTLGEYDQALQWCQRAMELCGSSLSAGHPETAATHRFMGVILTDLGRYPEARIELEKAFALARTAVDPAGSAMVPYHAAMAKLYRVEGKFDMAVAYQDSAYSISLAVSGAEYPSTIDALGHLGVYYGSTNDLDTAVAIIRGVLATKLRLYTANDPSVIASHYSLAAVLKSKGEFHEALAEVERALEAHRQLFGADHPEVATDLAGRAVILKNLERFQEGVEAIEQAIAIQHRVFGEEHPVLATSYSTLGSLLVKRYLFKEALVANRKALAMKQRTLGENHVEVAYTLASIGSCFYLQQLFDSALVYHEKALAVMEIALGKDHYELGVACNNIAVVLNAKGERSEAIVWLKRAVDQETPTLGEGSPATATKWNNIGTIYYELDIPDSAISYGERTLAVYERSLGLDNRGTLVVEYNLATTYAEARQDSNRALELVHRARNGAALREPDDWMKYMYMRFESHIHCALGNGDSAVFLGLRALELESRGTGRRPEHRVMANYYLGEAYCLQGRYREAQVMLDSAMTIARKPLPEFAWQSHLVSTALGEEDAAFDHLVRCVELHATGNGAFPKRIALARATLLAEARRKGRNDIIERFKLE